MSCSPESAAQAHLHRIRFFDTQSRRLLCGDNDGEDDDTDTDTNVPRVPLLSNGERADFIKAVGSTVGIVCHSFHSVHTLMLQREREGSTTCASGRTFCIVAWKSTEGVPLGICVLDVKQGDMVKSVFIRNFAMLVHGDSNPDTKRFIHVVRWLVIRTCDGPLWVKEPLEQRVDLWRETKLMESDERDRFRLVSRVSEDDDPDAFCYGLHHFLKDHLLYPQRIADAVLGQVGMIQVTAFDKRSTSADSTCARSLASPVRIPFASV